MAAIVTQKRAKTAAAKQEEEDAKERQRREREAAAAAQGKKDREWSEEELGACFALRQCRAATDTGPHPSLPHPTNQQGCWPRP